MTSELTILKNIRSLLSVNSAWIKHELALDENGDIVNPSSTHAVCWCINGARTKIAGGDNIGLFKDKFRRVYYSLYGRTGAKTVFEIPKTVFEINDDPSFTHEMLLSVLDHMIENEENAQ
jgi:hypothetical protein